MMHASIRQFRIVVLLAALIGIAANVPAARGQDIWELTSLKVHVVLACQTSPALGARAQEKLRDDVAARVAAVAGAAWHSEVTFAEGPSALDMLANLPTWTVDDVPEELLVADKVIFLTAESSPSTTELTARELDVRTRQFGPVISADVMQRELLTDDCLRLVFRAFRPLARIEKSENDRITLSLAGGALPPGDAELQWLAPGDLLEVAVRYNNRDGTLRQVRKVDWTYLIVEAVSGTGAECRLHTGLRSPLSSRRRGRVETLALAIGETQGATRLELRSTAEDPQPLVGYEIYDRSDVDEGRQGELLGTTDSGGSLEIQPGDRPLRELWVKDGSAWLARLPLVPGIAPVVEVELVDDGPRLEAEGFITGFQEELVDVVARRELLVALVLARLETGEIQEASALLERLRRLPSRQQMATTLVRQQRRIKPVDERQKRKIDKLFDDTLELVNRHLDPRPIDDLETRVIRARQQAEKAGGARQG